VFDHVTIRASDRVASERFYATVLRTLGIDQTHADEVYAEWDDFSLAEASDEHATRRLHIGFVAPSRAHVDRFWPTATDAGYRGATARRARVRSTGTTTTARSCSTPTGTAPWPLTTARRAWGGGIDHLWIRVAVVNHNRG
jgi:hypothetical protein